LCSADLVAKRSEADDNLTYNGDAHRTSNVVMSGDG